MSVCVGVLRLHGRPCGRADAETESSVDVRGSERVIHVVRLSVEGREQMQKKKKKRRRRKGNTQPTVGMQQITPGATRGAGSQTRLRRE